MLAHTPCPLHNLGMDQEKLRATEGAALFLAGKVDDDADRVLVLMAAAVHDAFGECPHVADVQEAATLMNAAGVVINAAERTADTEALRTGETWMSLVVDSGLLENTRFESTALYNLANSRIAIADSHLALAWSDLGESERLAGAVASRFTERERLRLARRDLGIASRLTEDGRERGMQLCNLANTFDHSGRWIEAYDAYVRALDADAGNGNAAGNAAVLIQKVIGSGWDFEGHLCSLYDHYLTMAHTNRAVTVEVAGEAAAQRFDAMTPVGSHEPLSDPHNQTDPYRRWVADHRLALVAAFEGLGAGDASGRWDTIALRSVTTSKCSTTPPPIFGILNILKADYLVARRLAFEADRLIEDTGCWAQHQDDPGIYTETLDYAVYGEVSSKLVLAHRAALDVLDKTAVAVNEHLQVGDDPRKVSFRSFWFENKSRSKLRSSLMDHRELSMGILSMAELAIDMAPGGMYSHAQDVRNAGTHRFVLIHHGITDIETTPTMQAMSLEGMREACHQSMTVARAAFIYLVALIEVFESRKTGTSGTKIPLFLPIAH